MRAIQNTVHSPHLRPIHRPRGMSSRWTRRPLTASPREPQEAHTLSAVSIAYAPIAALRLATRLVTSVGALWGVGPGDGLWALPKGTVPTGFISVEPVVVADAALVGAGAMAGASVWTGVN